MFDTNAPESCCPACHHAAETERRDAPPLIRPALVLASDAAAAPLGVSLRIRLGGEERIVPADKPALNVGRGPRCDVVVPSSALSRNQFRLTFEADGVFVRDLDSSCGTYVDGVAARGRVRLGRGSIIRAGDVEVEVISAL